MPSVDPRCDSCPCARVSPCVHFLCPLLAVAECWWLYLCHSGPKEGDKENSQQADRNIDGKNDYAETDMSRYFRAVEVSMPRPLVITLIAQISADGAGTAGHQPQPVPGHYN